ncbi:MAG: M1 family metallopeptidase [Christensenellaceae bacterium]|nr:M1 family metallopeptidase [Christensenellaceae bacterium]
MKILITFAVLLCGLLIILTSCVLDNSNIEHADSYDITMTIADDLKSVSMTETIKTQIVSNTSISSMVLNVYANAYRENAPKKAYFIGLEEYGGFELESAYFDDNLVEVKEHSNMTALEIILPHPVENGSVVNITIKGTFKVPSSNLRFGLSDGYLNLGSIIPVLAMCDNGNYRIDNYSRVGDPFYNGVANYTVNIIHPSELILATSGDSIETKSESEHTLTLSRGNNLRSFAIVACYDFIQTSKLINNIELLYYHKSDVVPVEHLNLASSVFSVFSEILGEYPYSKFSIVETSFYYSGMEYSNLVFVSAKATKKPDIIVHETIHQWFGCIVGNDTINCAWLDESLTTFLTDYYYLKTNGPTVFETRRMASKKAYDAFIGLKISYEPDYDQSIDRAIYKYAGNYEYSMLVYYRGSFLFDLIYEYAGTKKFEKALKYYYLNNRYKIASKDALCGAFSKNRVDIKPIVDAFLSNTIKTYALP